MRNQSLLFPFSFDVAKLNDDFVTCQELHWKDHFNQNDFNGSWTSISLRSMSGSETDIYAHSTGAVYKDTPALKACLYFQEILNLFQCELESVRLLCLAAGSSIKEHNDAGLGYEHGAFRLHIPIQTETEVSFIVAGSHIAMKAGECWYANFDLPHSVENQSGSDRIHLVIDGKRNTWTDELFAKAGYDYSFEQKQREPSMDTKRMMLAELRKMDNPAAREMVAKLEQELGLV